MSDGGWLNMDGYSYSRNPVRIFSNNDRLCMQEIGLTTKYVTHRWPFQKRVTNEFVSEYLIRFNQQKPKKDAYIQRESAEKIFAKCILKD